MILTNKSNKSNYLNNFMFSFLLFLASGFLITFPNITFAAPSVNCGLPVCDINQTIADLQKGTVEQRAQFLGNLYQQYRGTSDVKALQNIHDFSIRSYDLQKQLKDPANVLDWSIFLRELAIDGLLRFVDFDKTLFIQLYTETTLIPEFNKDRQQRVRYNSLQRWQLVIPTILDLNYVYGLYDYLNAALTISKQQNDEDYIQRQIAYDIDALGKQLSYLYPLYEGVYNVQIQCSPSADKCSPGDLLIDKIVVMNSFSDMGIFIGAAAQKNNIQNFLFYKSELGNSGTSLHSQSDVLVMGIRPAESFLRIDSKTQEISGSFLTSQYSGSLRFTGKVAYSPLHFYVDEGPGTDPYQVLGQFEGTIGNQKAKMIIRQRKDKTLFATCYVGEQDSLLKIDFSAGEFIQHRGIIELIGFGTAKLAPYKLLLAYRMDPTKKTYHWTGSYFSMNGTFSEAEFIRTGDVDTPPQTPTTNLK